MQEWRIGRLLKPETDATDSAVWRTLWRRLHPERRAPEAEIHATHRGPYETSYSVQRGYAAERSIIRP
jgi:hypothetical protein